MRLVIVETPYAGDVARNVEYARRAMRDCLRRGEAPFLSHLLYTQVLCDLVPELRHIGISAGLEWGSRADATVVYTDNGISDGMQKGIEHAEKAGRPVEYRQLGQLKPHY